MDRIKHILTRPLVWVVIALGLRLLYLAESSGSFQFFQLILDEQEVAHAAREGFGDEPLFKAPLYALFVRAIMALTGEGWMYGVRFVQHLLGAVLVWLLYDATFRLSRSRAAAALAAAFGALYGPLIRLEDRLILDFLVVFLQSAMLWALVRGLADRQRWKWLLFASFFAALSWLNRPTIMPVLPFITAWVFFVHGRSWKRAGVFLLLPVLAITALTLRNGMVAGEYISSPWQGGYNFYIANNEQSNGRYAIQHTFDVSESGNPSKTRMIQDYQAAHTDDPEFEFSYEGMNDYWFDRGWEVIAADPLAWVGKLMQRAFYLVTAREIYNFEDYHIQRSLSSVLKPARVNFGWIWPLAIGALAFVRRQSGEQQSLYWLYILLLGGAIGLFFCSGRLRMPLMFPVTVLAASGAIMLLRTRQWKVYLPLLILGSAMSWGDWWGVRSEDVGYVEYARLSNVAWHAEEFELALDFAEKAAVSRHNYPAIPQLRGQAYYSLGKIDEAIAAFETAHRYLKQDPVPPYNLGRIYYHEKKDLDQALHYLVYAHTLKYKPAVPMLARVELKRGNVAKANQVMAPLLHINAGPLDLEGLITTIFLLEAAGLKSQVPGLVQEIQQRFGEAGLAVFAEEVAYFKP